MKRFTLVLVCAVVSLFISCINRNVMKRKFDSFHLLKSYMSGEFSSTLQSQQDSDFFDIRLRMVPIWNSTATEFYLYVEQAVSTSIDKPYRQRIYKVEKINETEFVSHIYTVAAPARLVGKKGDDPIFNQLAIDSLQIKDGCAVYLNFNESTNDFSGSTKDGTCPSDRQGAKFTSSKVTINSQQMVSWDQGWNGEGKQVWGATKGGYIFVKQN